jgi:hypothetical protein
VPKWLTLKAILSIAYFVALAIVVIMLFIYVVPGSTP